MRKQTNNICKMIGKVNADLLYTTNFVYETNDGGAMGTVAVRKSNAVHIVVSGQRLHLNPQLSADLQCLPPDRSGGA